MKQIFFFFFVKVNGKFECIAFMKFEMKNISNSTVLIKIFFDLVKDKKYKCIKFTKLKRISKSTKKTSFCKKKTKNKEFYNKTKQTPFYIFFIQSEHEGLELRFRRSSSKVYIVSFQY